MSRQSIVRACLSFRLEALTQSANAHKAESH
jgi:hypothetical protein